MVTKKPKYYAVRVGRETGIFRTWEACKNATHGYSGAVYKSFDTEEAARAWFYEKPLNDSSKERLNTPFDNSLTNQYDTPFDNLSDYHAHHLPDRPSPFQPDYDVYTDGSYHKGQYAWAYAFVKDDEVVYEDSNVGKNPEAAVMRNVAGEIAAVLHAVKRAAELGVRIRIYHDYAGIAFWVTGEWQAKNEFTRNYAQLMKKYQGRYVFAKVKAHSGNQFNEYVDKKAKAALGIE